MPRIARGSLGGVFVPVINRGNGRRPVFHDEDDYGGFVELLGEARERTAMPLAGLCLMPDQLKSSLSPLSSWPEVYIWT
jgi:putative transposase